MEKNLIELLNKAKEAKMSSYSPYSGFSVGAALLCAFSEYLVPESWQKYMKLISGFIIISILLSPFTKQTDTQIFEGFELDSSYTEEGEELMYEEIKTELEKKVAEDIKLRVAEEFSANVEAEVKVKTASDGKIEKVDKILLTGDKNNNITERIKFVYGTEEVIWLE